MDLKFWIWLIVIIATLIARASKKKSPPTVSDQKSNPFPDREPRAATGKSPQTFEELLQEIQGSKLKPAARQVEPEKHGFDDHSKFTREKPLEDTDYDYRQHDTIYDIYDNAKKEAFLRPSLEETMKLEDTVIRFNPFKGYEQVTQPSLAAELAREIQTPSGFKKAFIMSEILKRRF